MLMPFGLTIELYYVLKSGSKNKENIFYSWRQRYGVAAYGRYAERAGTLPGPDLPGPDVADLPPPDPNARPFELTFAA